MSGGGRFGGGARRLPAVFAAVLLLALFALPTASVWAHANLAEASPGVGAVLTYSPTQIRLRFTEPLAPEFSRIEVLDATGQRVDAGNSRVDPDDPYVMTVSVTWLEAGLYTVSWRNLSTVDGHTLRGSYVFSVGVPLDSDAAFGANDPLFASPWEPLARWLVLLSVLGMAGAPIFWCFVAAPAVADPRIRLQAKAAGLEDTVWRLFRAAAALFVVSTIFHLLVQTSTAHDLPLHRTLFGPAFAVVAQTSWGSLWLWRTGVLLAMLLVVFAATRRLRDGRPRTSGAWLAALLLGAGGLLTISLASHAAATPEVRWQAVSSDFLHLVAVAAWAGGLAYLGATVTAILRGFVAEERAILLNGIVPRFSILGILSVGTLAITGLYAAWVQVHVPAAVATPYGFTLLAKILLILPLLGLAAVNLLWIKPRLQRDEAHGWLFRRLVRAEIALVTLVILATGVMTSMQPARQAISQGPESAILFHEVLDRMDMTLTIRAGLVGANDFEMVFKDRAGRPLTTVQGIEMVLYPQAADLAEMPFFLTQASDGVWVQEDVFLSVAGTWEIHLDIFRSDDFDLHYAYLMNVALAADATAVPTAELDPILGRWLWGVEILLLASLFASVFGVHAGWFRRRTNDRENATR